MVRFFFAFILLSVAAEAHVTLSQDLESKSFDLSLEKYENCRINEVKIVGTHRTNSQAIKDLFGIEKGDTFEKNEIIAGLKRLYSTQVLYDVKINSVFVDEENNRCDVELDLSDKWTLFPYFTWQMGGGSWSGALGINEGNLFGEFTNAWVQIGSWDGRISYEVAVQQEWFRDWDTGAGLGVSQTTFPFQVVGSDGQSTGSFDLERRAKTLYLWNRIRYDLRLNPIVSFYTDQVVSTSGNVESEVYQGVQTIVKFPLVFGRVQWTNFLEDGKEFIIEPVTRNVFRADGFGQGLVFKLKNVKILKGNDNFAYFLRSGAMTSLPYVYQFNLGGFDTVRGFSINRARGQHFLQFNLEYRKFFSRFDFPVLDFGTVITQFVPFLDGGVIGGKNIKTQQLLSGGLGIHFNFVHFAGAIVRMDLARTLYPDEGFGFSLGVGQLF